MSSRALSVVELDVNKGSRTTAHRLVRLRWLRFSLVGGVGFFVDGLALVVLYHVLGIDALAARAASFSVAVFVTWSLNRRYTFGAGEKRASYREFLRYLTANCLGLAVNLAVYVLAITANGYLGKRPLLALALAAVSAATANYIMAARFVFASRRY